MENEDKPDKSEVVDTGVKIPESATAKGVDADSDAGGVKIPESAEPVDTRDPKDDNSDKNIMITRRNLVKLGIGIVVATGVGYYAWTLLSKPKKVIPPPGVTPAKPTPTETVSPTPTVPAYYQITLENGEAKALNVKKNTIDFQSSNHYSVIQNCLNSLPSRNTKLKVGLTGDFTCDDTIKIPSYTIFELDGSITLGANIDKVLVQESSPLIGTIQIEMIGGTYDGNKNNQKNINPIIGFTKVSQSHFANITTQNGTKGFILDTGCNNNICDKVVAKNNLGAGTLSSGNGLGDRGDHNIWNDCVADGSSSDNWIIKCRDSIFNRCIGSNSLNAVGFGFYADRDITDNQLNACEAYGNKTNGVSLNIPDTSNGKAIKLINNIIQGIFHDNQDDGVRLTNMTEDGMLQNNNFDILTYSNGEDGFDIQQQTITNNSGTIVAYDNPRYDAYIKGSSNNFDIFHQGGKVTATSGNTANKSEISCGGSSNSWAMNKYCNSQ